MLLQELLDLTVKNNASDLHLIPDISPVIRIDGELTYLTNYTKLSEKEVEEMIFAMVGEPQKELLINNKELDFSIPYGGGVFGDLGRFRVNAYYQRSALCAALRYLPKAIRTIDELHLPKICYSFSQLRQGLILVTGPTGQGKSTTLAAVINEINMTRAAHILTIEDPIEYMYPDAKSIIS